MKGENIHPGTFHLSFFSSLFGFTFLDLDSFIMADTIIKCKGTAFF